MLAADFPYSLCAERLRVRQGTGDFDAYKKRLTGGTKYFQSVFLFFVRELFPRNDGTCRASVCASAAVDANLRIDRINVTFLDGT